MEVESEGDGSSSDVGVGDTIIGRFRLRRHIGDGSYGIVFLAHDLCQPEASPAREVALKMEKPRGRPRPLLRLEALILTRLRKADHDTSPAVLATGTHPVPFIAMTLVGPDISTVRKGTAHGRLHPLWVMPVARHMFKAIRALHDVGFVHRDIKPSNFALNRGPDGSGCHDAVFLLDFGLARQYALTDGQHRAPRRNAGFRGTRIYASLNALFRREQSRRDDLASLFYLIVELLRGPLPWRQFREPMEFRTAKLLYPPADLLEGLADELARFRTHVLKLSYYEKPDYDLLLSLLENSGIAPKDPVLPSTSLYFPLPPPAA